MKVQENFKITGINDVIPVDVFNAPLRFSRLDFANSRKEGGHIVVQYIPENHTELFAYLGSSTAMKREYTPCLDDDKTQVFLWIDTDSIPLSATLQVVIYPHLHSEIERAAILRDAQTNDKRYNRHDDDCEADVWQQIFQREDDFCKGEVEPEFEFFTPSLEVEEINYLTFMVIQFLMGDLVCLSVHD